MLALYGCDGFAREVIPFLIRSIGATSKGCSKADIVLVDDNSVNWGRKIHGLPVISFDDLLGEDHRKRKISICIADPKVRSRIAQKCEIEGLSFFSAVAPTSISGHNVEVGDGAILSDYTILTGDAKIGRHFHANIYSYVAHDCVIGDFVTFAPRVSCNGRVVIEDFAYVGTGAVLRQGAHDKPLRIGREAVIGMGAVVTKDVAAGSVVVGNPARPLDRG